jgi:hypothetical protein
VIDWGGNYLRSVRFFIFVECNGVTAWRVGPKGDGGVIAEILNYV